MSAASAGIRQLRESDISQMFTEEGVCSLKAVDLPAVFHSDRLRDNDAFAQFCSEHAPLRVERYPQGKILVMAPAHSKTGHLELLLGMELGIWTRGNATGMAFGPSAGFDLREECVLAPDGSWVALDRWNALTLEEQSGFAPICPDFVIELRSSSDGVAYMDSRMKMWTDKGAKLAWMVDPKRKLAIVYRQGQEPETISAPELLEAEGPVAGFRLEMSRFWV